MKKKAVVLLSSGLDSTVNLYKAHAELDVVLALSFDYGQKAAVQEMDSAKKLCRQLKVPHKTLDLKWFRDFESSSLLSDQKIPVGADVAIDNFEVSQQTAKAVWVPNRNGIFLNIAAGFAESLKADFVIPGFNAEEAATFPDNTGEFLDSLTQSFSHSTANKVQAFCYTTKLNKVQIVELGESLDVPWHLTWPCYFSFEKWCGRCESCQRAQRAFQTVGVEVQALFKS